MPEENLKAGSWVGDITNEWRRAKTPEKVIIVLAVGATIGIALYLHRQSQGPNQPGAQGSGVGGIPANFQQGSGGGGASGGSSTPAPAPTPTPAPPTKSPGQPPVQSGGKPPAKPIAAPAPGRPPTKPVAPARQPTQLATVYARHPVTYGGRPAGGPVAPGGVNPPVRNAPPDYTRQDAPYIHPTHGPF